MLGEHGALHAVKTRCVQAGCHAPFPLPSLLCDYEVCNALPRTGEHEGMIQREGEAIRENKSAHGGAEKIQGDKRENIRHRKEREEKATGQ